MKKILITSIALGLGGLINAQIILTKDTSYGNSGEFVYSDEGAYSGHKFIGDKLLIAYTYLNIAGNNKYVKYTRLNSNGIPDVGFGNNGSFVDSGSLGMPSPLTDANLDYLINYSESKYFSNGQSDPVFQMNWGINNMTGKYYLNILPDGHILFRKDNYFTKILDSGALDPSYGTNGKLNTLDYSSSFIYGKIINNSAYEFGGDPSNPDNHGIRKINISTGTLDLNYGVNGLGQTSITPSSIRNSSYNPSDDSMLNMLNGDSSSNYQYLISKTKSNGLLDAGFGTNGVFTLNKEINTVEYTYYSDFYQDNASNVFSLVKSTEGDIAIVCYSPSGSRQNINGDSVFNTGDNIYTTYNYGDYPNFQVVGNYLYFFSPKKIIRYIISEQAQVLSTESGKIEKVPEFTFENPFKNELTLHTKERIKNIQVYNENGYLVLKSKDLKLNTTSLVNGMYLIKITTASNQIISKKAIKN